MMTTYNEPTRTTPDAGDQRSTDPRPAHSAGAGSAATGGRRDRVHWGPVWAGVLVALPVFVVLQLLFFSLSWLDLGNNGSGQSTTASIVSAVLALIAFFVGGLLAGNTAASRDSDEGLLHGVLTWALATVAILAFTVIGGGALLGNLAASSAQLQQAGSAAGGIDPNVALQTAHQSAGWAALWLGLSVLAAAVGGLTGQKTGGRR